MKTLLSLLVLFLVLPSLAATRIVFVNGINVDDDGRRDSREKIREVLIREGHLPKLGGDSVLITSEANPGDGLFDDVDELVQQAKYSGQALTAAKLIDHGANAQTAVYRDQLGRLYAAKLADRILLSDVERRIVNVVEKLSTRLRKWVVDDRDKVILVAHSQGNFFGEAVHAYLRHSTSDRPDHAALIDSNLRFVGVASVAASTPHGRYVSAHEDIALDLQRDRTVLVRDYSLLPRNINFCTLLERLIPGDPCMASLRALDPLPIPLVHGFVKIYMSDLLDRSSDRRISSIIAALISDSFDEINLPVFGPTTRVSVASDGSQGNGAVWVPSLSADGRYVAFMSFASNLVPGDTNGAPDIFVHDRQTRETTRISVASDGTQALGAGSFDIERPSISADGRFVAFTSSAHNLVPGDTNGGPDVFVHDRVTHQTTRVSVSSSGTQANVPHPYGSRNPSISADGRYVVFVSAANNLVLNDTNGYDDVFLHDRVWGTTVLISAAVNGTSANHSSHHPTISSDGSHIAFQSGANNLLDGLPKPQFESNIFVHDRTNGMKSRVDIPSNGDQSYQNANSFYASISADGRYVTFQSDKTNLVAADTNAVTDIFVHDRTTRTTTRVSVTSSGIQANALSEIPAISGDGRFVVFTSVANNLAGNTDANGIEDVFVHDRQTMLTRRVSVASDGMEGNNESFGASISADGRSIAFVSAASNLIAADSNGQRDVFAVGSFETRFISPPQPVPYVFAGETYTWISQAQLSASTSYVFYCKDTAGAPTIDFNAAGPGSAMQIYLRFGGGFAWREPAYCILWHTDNGGVAWSRDIVIDGFYLFGNPDINSFRQFRSQRAFTYNGFPHDNYINPNFGVSGINAGEILIPASQF